MAKWTDKYELVGIVPGEVILKDGSRINFSDPDLKIETVDKAYATGTRYLKLKEKKKNSADT